MPRFSSVCIVTADVPRLREFYRAVLQVAGEGDNVFTAFSTDECACVDV